jgi:hypothetical protein
VEVLLHPRSGEVDSTVDTCFWSDHDEQKAFKVCCGKDDFLVLCLEHGAVKRHINMPLCGLECLVDVTACYDSGGIISSFLGHGSLVASRRSLCLFVLFSQALRWDSLSRDLSFACVMDRWSLHYLAMPRPTIWFK